ncbi:hypothetical protein [Ramlibacter sp.]|uniref:hypothetical protein n=1 Tax=Ramlibacter sp. TaxID=1917967 RepID=UPI0026212095|nr:hypothetical protein [Ramlibacter sp.]
MKQNTLWVAAALALCLPILAQAQSDPADSKSPAVAPRFESAFADYKPWKDVSAGDWRAANEAVGPGATAAAQGGHGPPAAVAAPAAAQKTAPAAAASSHEGHDMHDMDHMQGGQK